mmetsp:Transcript_40563/g.117277  ORF Transcript_40563/g.117277 Transcript_40563/m.117277 type:complete len:294 (+) Transcript_40563:403-1284(+)
MHEVERWQIPRGHGPQSLVERGQPIAGCQGTGFLTAGEREQPFEYPRPLNHAHPPHERHGTFGMSHTAMWRAHDAVRPTEGRHQAAVLPLQLPAQGADLPIGLWIWPWRRRLRAVARRSRQCGSRRRSGQLRLRCSSAWRCPAPALIQELEAVRRGVGVNPAPHQHHARRNPLCDEDRFDALRPTCGQQPEPVVVRSGFADQQPCAALLPPHVHRHEHRAPEHLRAEGDLGQNRPRERHVGELRRRCDELGSGGEAHMLVLQFLAQGRKARLHVELEEAEARLHRRQRRRGLQ